MNSVIIINSDHLDWIIRNPYVFTRALIGRIQSEEVDPYPGYSRWHGDAMPGVQVAYVGKPETLAVIMVENNAGKKILSLPSYPGSANLSQQQQELAVLKELASKLGYDIISNGGQPVKGKRQKPWTKRPPKGPRQR